MKKKIQFLLILCAMVAVLPAWGQHERIYIQTDKDFYVAGEDMLLNVIGMDELCHPLSLSRIAYVELLGDLNNAVRVKVKLTDGKGTATIPLPLQLASGTYSLVAYTRWMRNEGEQAFFRKDIAVFNSLRYLPDIDQVQFTDTCSGGSLTTEQGNAVVTIGKQAYGQREKVELHLQGIPENTSVTVSVARADAYTKTNGLKETQHRFSATKDLSDTEYLPELEGMLIEGEWIADESESSTPLRPNLSLQGDILHYYAGQPTSKGNFIFYTPPLEGMEEVVAGSYNNGHIKLLSPFIAAQPAKMQSLHLCKDMEAELTERCLAVQAKRLVQRDTVRTYGESIPGYNCFSPRWSYDLDQYRRFPTLEETFLEFVSGVSTALKEGHKRITIFDETVQKVNQGNTLVMLDGVVITDHEALLAYNPRLIKWVDVYTQSYVFGEHFYNGILSLRTPHRTLAGFRLPDNSVITEYEGVRPQATLPQEEYPANAAKEKHTPDLRHTLYWNPKVTATDTSLEFTTSDLCGTFIVTVEGITPDGAVIHGRASFEVNGRSSKKGEGHN